jgi:LysM repeat protein
VCKDIRVISVFIMKVSKIFGCVLGLHFGVIAVLLIQPGCRTKQPPTQTYTQDRTTDGFIPATGVAPGDGLDAAFNAGFEDGRPAVDSAANEFSEFDNVAPLTPLTPLTSGGQSVQVAGPSFEAYTVEKGDNLWSIAKRYNVSLNELYAANGLNKNSVLRIGQQIQVPVEGGTASISTVSADTYQPTSFNQGSTSYTVKRGDTLSKIANQYDTSVRAIKAANSMTSDLIRVGDTLVIPVGANANTSGASVASSGTFAASAAPSSTVTTSASRTHTVKPGEYPATIARQYGMPTGELLALNGITDPRKLQVGQVLKINGSGSAANVDSRTETVVSPAPATASPTPASPAPRVPVTSSGPVEIRVIEADPLVEGEATEIQTDEMFDGAVEIPVIRLEESASSASSSPL